MKLSNLAAASAVMALAVASLFVGVIDIGLNVLTDPGALGVMLSSRIPRTLAVILTGASMAVAGLIMQLLAHNRFIEPTTAGTGQSAALGILCVTVFWPGAPIWAQMTLASFAAMAGSIVFLLMVRRLPPAQPLLVPLVGLIYGGIIDAAVTFVGFQTDLLQYVSIWMNGEFSGVLAGRYELLWVSGALTLLAYLVADRFTIASLGREASVSLGLNYNRIVLAGLLIVSTVTALTVVTVGMLPFVGLVVPNVVSRIYGDNLRATLPIVALAGSALVLVCDILGRVVRYPYEIPVGTIFGIVGAVIFLVLLYARPARA